MREMIGWRMRAGETSTQWDSGAADDSASVTFDDDVAVDPAVARSLHVVVVGAGAFGGWTALHLLRAGARVTLLDSWGPGNGRSSSGGETRAIRGVYGGDHAYVAWTAKSLGMWRDFEADFQGILDRHRVACRSRRPGIMPSDLDTAAPGRHFRRL